MKTYFVELRSQDGDNYFRSEFASPNARLAFKYAMDAAEAALKLTPYVRVLDENCNMVWDSFDAHNVQEMIA